MQRRAQEELLDLEELSAEDDMPYGEFDNTACRIMDYFTHLAQGDDPGMTIQRPPH